MENVASKGPPMKNLVCNEKFGINCASAEAHFGTGRGIICQMQTAVQMGVVQLGLVQMRSNQSSLA